jgi:thiosulfate/3-mercaptopyruvate sulfurtransferase
MRNRISIILLASLLAPAAFAAPTCGGHGNKDTMLVSAAWLSAHLKDPNLVVLSIGSKDEYAKEHIPGTQMISLQDVATPMVMGQLMLELLPQDQLVKAFATRGITNESHIVLYMTAPAAISQTTRVYLTFDAMGLGAQTSILDGGFAAWKAAGNPVTAEASAPKPGKLDLCPQSDVITTADWVHDNVKHKGAAIIDARATRFYSGEAAGQNHDGSEQRKGHIPGAGNIPFNSLIDEKGFFLKPDQLREKFASAGAKTGDRVVSYCHIGQQATVVYFAARFLGYDARLYDGSFEDWNSHSAWPVEQ